MFSATAVRLFTLGASLVGFAAGNDAQAHPVHGGSNHTGRAGFSHAGEPHGQAISARSHGFAGFERSAGLERSIGSFNVRRGEHSRRYAIGHGHSGGGVQCVTFARADSGIELSGNASAWWDNAAGIYQRGARPESGAVLNFRANGSMRMGHVAVVNQVENSRTIDIDHANWGGPGALRGGISRNIQVVDVSPNNDWSAVRVALGHSGEFGSIYPTYGFIYDRPDAGTMLAANDRSAPMAGLNPAPRDLRLRAEMADDEVAEATDGDDAPRYYTRRHGHYHASHSRAGRHLALDTSHHRSHRHA